MWDSIDPDRNTKFWRVLMSAYVVPSALSVPFNVMLARHEYHRIVKKQQGGARRRGEQPSPLLFIAALLALLFVVMGPLCTLFAQYVPYNQPATVTNRRNPTFKHQPNTRTPDILH